MTGPLHSPRRARLLASRSESAEARAAAAPVPPGVSCARIAGQTVHLLPEAALWWPERRLLAVADLHLEKATALARDGLMLPPYDSAATLKRLAAVIARLDPATVIALGDSFHDRGGPDRLDAVERGRLESLATGRDFIWITGNHDGESAGRICGRVAFQESIGALVFRHEPLSGPADGEVAGHLHPSARVATRGGTLRRRCFATDGTRMILPAFGALTGGLDVLDAAFAAVFPERAQLTAHVVGAAAVHPVRAARLVPDRRRP